ncbi:hypothetical protein B0H13DRAFT_1858924 [Mycena leptocephala]|nr:hypothetical protein B0H13DRAFT_1858924 [Mycena leptocephala]
MPLENIGGATEWRMFGNWNSTIYRAVNSLDGATYALHRIENYHLNHQAALGAIKMWACIRHPGVVDVHEAFTTHAFGDSSLVVTYAYHPRAEHHCNREVAQSGLRSTPLDHWSKKKKKEPHLKRLRGQKPHAAFAQPLSFPQTRGHAANRLLSNLNPQTQMAGSGPRIRDGNDNESESDSGAGAPLAPLVVMVVFLPSGSMPSPSLITSTTAKAATARLVQQCANLPSKAVQFCSGDFPLLLIWNNLTWGGTN